MGNIDYKTMSNDEKRVFINEQYHELGKSWAAVAELAGTYKNKVRRDALRLEIPSRDKSEAQNIALKQGRSIHPTEGKPMSDEAKLKLSNKMGEVWDNLTETERVARAATAKESWDRKTPEEKQHMMRSGLAAVREAGKTGSKLEHYLLERLTEAGYKTIFHLERVLDQEVLQIDLYVQDLAVAIEVDGPSHQKPLWGKDDQHQMALYLKRRDTDIRKEGFILKDGSRLVRVVQQQSLSQRYQRQLWEKLAAVLQQIKDGEMPREKRVIVI